MTDYPEFTDYDQALEQYAHDSELYSVGPMWQDHNGVWNYSRSM